MLTFPFPCRGFFGQLAGLAAFCFAGLALQAQPTFQVLTTLGLVASNPYGGVIQATDGKLYGTTKYGGLSNQGTVFRENVDGTGFTTLHLFVFSTDGNSPLTSLIQGIDGNLYGTASANGVGGWGSLFRMHLDGTGFTILHDFVKAVDGGTPNTTLIQATDGNLYGTCYTGGVNNNGTIYKIAPDGSGFAVVRQLTLATDGDRPNGVIQASDGRLYSTTYSGTTLGGGGLISVHLDGTGFAVIRSFTAATDGAYSDTPLIQGSDGRLYGATSYLGPTGYLGVGTIFGINLDGSGFAVLETGNSNTGGSSPLGALTQASDGMLYGTLYGSGPVDPSVVFRMNTDGTGYTVLRTLVAATDGTNPSGKITQGSDGTLYGTTENGGSASCGTIFELYSSAPTITSAAAIPGTYGTAFSSPITATAGPTSYLVTGTLPTGLAFNSTTGLISGTPTQTGAFPVTLKATNPIGTGTLAATITIGPAPLTVTAQPVSIGFSSPIPPLTAALSGFVNSDTAAVVSGAAVVTTTATAGSAVGSYPITATVGTLTATNYTFGPFVGGTLSISAGLSQTITFGALPSRLYGSGSFVLSASATSGLPVTFAVTGGPATLVGSTVTITGAGLVSITATQSGNGTYSPASPVLQTFSVTPAPATITLGSLLVGFNGSPQPVTVTTSPFGLTYSVTYSGSSAAPSAVGTYPVVATITNPNYVGTSSANLVIATGSAPLFTLQPASQTVFSGTAVQLTTAVTSSGAVSLQWYKNNVAVPGATSAILTFPTVVLSQSGNYFLSATNSFGTSFSITANLQILSAISKGFYFGNIVQVVQGLVRPAVTASGGGSFALYVRPDGTSLLLAYLPGSQTAYSATPVVDGDGNFTAATTNVANPSLSGPIVQGRLVNGNLTASIAGLSLSLTGTESPATGPTPNGYFSSTALGTTPEQAYAIVGPDGRMFVLLETGSTVDGGTGTAQANGSFAVTTGQGIVFSGQINSASGQLTAQAVAGTGIPTSFAGVSAAVTASQALVDASARAQVGTGSSVLTTGFVIGGTGTKQVLLRASGPALIPFGLTGTLAQPVLTLYQGSTILAANQGWGTAANAGAITAAATAGSAFPFAAGSADAAILTTLPPGAYTAVVSGAQGGTGVALAEIYDISRDATTLLNVSTRGVVGAGNQVLIVGVVVAGNTPEKLLIRAVGPGLQTFGVAGAIADPQLQVIQGSTVLAANDNWNGDPTITAAAAAAGAFPLSATSKDAAVIVTLNPGSYTIVVSGVAGATGVALVESYQIP
jgi:uncharacterized repeat protein (TIGR03803 family)